MAAAGNVKSRSWSDGIALGMRLSFDDQGPGIANLELAMTDGWTSGGGLGLGLTGAKRLVNEFEIDSHRASAPA